MTIRRAAEAEATRPAAAFQAASGIQRKDRRGGGDADAAAAAPVPAGEQVAGSGSMPAVGLPS